jgi:hypothetical protein
MWYLKCCNVPLKILKDPKYGNGNSMAWSNCGFNIHQISRDALQYDKDGMFNQYLPIADKGKFDAIHAELSADIATIGGCMCEVIEDTDGSLYAIWKAERDAALIPPEV